MKTIGLLDIDCSTSKKHWGGMVYPNLALCKIAAWHKAQGDRVEWATPFEHYDILYRSKIFNFSDDDLRVYNFDKEVRGGTGYSITATLPPEVDGMQPDLSIYPNLPADTSYGFLTRGCPNRCRWCIVPKKEGAIVPYWDVDRVANGRTNIILFDNNILAAGDYCLQQLQKIIDRGYKVDFNQAIDARLVTPTNAKLLAQVKFINKTIRFGCDQKAQIEECERAMELLEEFGFRGNYMLYTMLTDNFKETYERLWHWWACNTLGRKNIICQSQPFRDTERKNEPPQWQKDMARWSNNRALFTSTPFAQYEPRKGFKCQTYIDTLI